MRFLIRADGSEDLGLGHLNRCCVLAEALRRLGHSAILLVRDSPLARNFLRSKDATFSTTPDDPGEWPSVDVSIVDLYRYDHTYYETLRATAQKIVIFDDIEYRVPSGVDGVINVNCGVQESRYPESIRKFLGPQYYPIRREFHPVRGKCGRGEHVLICLGGGDQRELLSEVVKAVRSATRRPLDIVAPLEAGQVIRTPSMKDGQARIHPIGPGVIESIAKQAAFAVCGAGTLLYELAFLGIPAICLPLAANQTLTAREFVARGAALGPGRGEFGWGGSELPDLTRQMDLAPEFRQKVADRARRLVDGKGAERLALGLASWAASHQTAFRREEIAEEYDTAAKAADDHARVKWGSREGMIHRFELALRELRWAPGGDWLDVGCGSGVFQEMVLRRFPAIQATGIDLSARLLDLAKRRMQGSNITFRLQDFRELREEKFDWITAIGVLQKTTLTPEEFFLKIAELLRMGGQVFVNTKHLGWERFLRGDLRPEASHLWFSAHELRAAAEAAGLRVCKVAGFLPRAGAVVPLEKSHDLFLVAEKGA